MEGAILDSGFGDANATPDGGSLRPSASPRGRGQSGRTARFPDTQWRTIGITVDLSQIRTDPHAYPSAMRSRRISKFTALLSLAVMLFAQAAIALADCDIFLSAQAHSVIASGNESPEETCHESGANANLCAAHCQGEDLSLDKPQVKVHALLAQAVLVWRPKPALLRDSLALARQPEAWAVPPPRILFRSLLI